MIIEVDSRLCKGCGVCIYACPKKVFAIRQSVNAKGFTYAEPAVPEACVGCGLCVKSCPDFAVMVSKEEDVRV